MSPLEQGFCFAPMEGHHEVNPSVLLVVDLMESLALESLDDQESGHPFVELTDQGPDLVLEN